MIHRRTTFFDEPQVINGASGGFEIREDLDSEKTPEKLREPKNVRSNPNLDYQAGKSGIKRSLQNFINNKSRDFINRLGGR